MFSRKYCTLLLDQQSKILLASDGGMVDPHGYYAWAIGTTDDVVCYNSGTVFGWPLSSFWAEAYGRLSFLRFLYHIPRYLFGTHHMQFPTIASYCNNSSVVKAENSFDNRPWTPSTVLRSDYDLVKQIEVAKAECPIPYTNKWIKGHQDNTISFHNLSRPSQLNVIVDHFATKHRWVIWKNNPEQQIQGPRLPAPTATLKYKKTTDHKL